VNRSLIFYRKPEWSHVRGFKQTGAVGPTGLNRLPSGGIQPY